MTTIDGPLHIPVGFHPAKRSARGSLIAAENAKRPFRVWPKKYNFLIRLRQVASSSHLHPIGPGIAGGCVQDGNNGAARSVHEPELHSGHVPNLVQAEGHFRTHSDVESLPDVTEIV